MAHPRLFARSVSRKRSRALRLAVLTTDITLREITPPSLAQHFSVQTLFTLIRRAGDRRPVKLWWALTRIKKPAD